MNLSREAIELFRKLKNDDLSAFNKIYNLYSQRVLNFAYSFSISIEDAEEIVQDTFLKLWRKRDRIDLNKPVDSLIFVIAKNLALNKIKQYSVEEEHLRTYFKEKEKGFGIDIEQKLNFQEIEAVINRIIEELPEKRREIFKLSRFKELSYKEIAEHLNISVSTVEKQMIKALKTVNDKFGIMYKLIFVALLIR